MRFKNALWDESDPLYAPCMTRAGKYFYWVAQKKYADMGYTPKRERLPGTLGDDNDRDRAAKCRELTRNMINHYAVEDEPTVQIGTWEWIFMRYKTDPESPYQGVKGNTRELYDVLIKTWIEAIGGTSISTANFRAVRRWEQAMEKKGRSRDWISKMFGQMRRTVKYGAAIEDAECQRFQTVLSNMTFKKGTPKDTSGTPEQIEAIIQAAKADGAHSIYLGLMLQWWFSMRPVDVRGQWLKCDDAATGIVRNGTRWQDGLTWDMIDREVTSLKKTFSKTQFTTGKTLTFDLTQVPEIREALLAIPVEKRVGPVIVAPRTGLPYTRHGWRQAWATYRTAAKVPDSVKNMGIRPTALTHGDRAGASPFQLRDAAGHADIKTTNRYIRGADQAASMVVELRKKM